MNEKVTNAIVILFIIGFFAVACWAVIYSTQKKNACEAKGGMMVKASDGYICIDRKSVIKIN